MTRNTEADRKIIRIDCRGVKISTPVLEIFHDGVFWQFVIDPKLRAGTEFHAGLFINLEINSPEALRYPLSQRFCALFESPINHCYKHLDQLKSRFHTIFTHQQHLIDQGAPFEPLMFGTNWLGVRTAEQTQQILSEDPLKRQNISFMGSIQHAAVGAYSFRREVAEFALAQANVECFGKGIREVSGKKAAIGPFRFSIAMENAASDFYFSEKLVDCLLLKTVPIYFGCPRIGQLFDTRGFLSFTTMEELRTCLSRATEETYRSMLPFIHANRETVVREGWHSHNALFLRLAKQLSLRVDSEVPPVSLSQCPHGRTIWGELLGKVKERFL